MNEDAQRFRDRARECRRLASDALDEFQRRTLCQMADELEEEADKIDEEGRGDIR